MPANLTPEYLAAEKRYRTARTDEDRLDILQEMLRVIPKHKGTDHLQGDLRKRISQLRRLIADKRTKRKRRGPSHAIRHEGAGQVVLVGPPNTGKSQLVASLTRATPEVASYPYTTQKALPAMMPYEDVFVQLVDLPPITAEHTEPWVYEVIRAASAMVIVVDCTARYPANEIATTVELLEKAHVVPLDPANEDLHDIFLVEKPACVALNKVDTDGDQELVVLVGESYTGNIPLIPVSGQTGRGLERFRESVYSLLDVIRIYSKIPGKKADMSQPYTLPRGSSLNDFARTVHKDFAEQLKYARVWGSTRHDGQTVPRDYILTDKDVIELHM